MASISEGVDDDDQSVTSAALGIESSATSFAEAIVPDDATAPSPRARRPRRAVNYYDSESDDDDDEDLELAPPDDEDGWD